MRFKPVGPVAIRQATKDFDIPPATLKGCPLGLSFRKGDSAIVYLEGTVHLWCLHMCFLIS